MFVDVVSSNGDVLRTMPAAVESELVCAPGEETWRVRAYIPLDESAAEIRLRRGERALWEMRIPDKPEIRIELAAIPSRGEGGQGGASLGQRSRSRARRKGSEADDDSTLGFPGGRPAWLSLELSAPADVDLAYLTVVHRWGEGHFHTVYIGPIEQRLEIPADRLPGGEDCQLVVMYSNGLRSATAATDSFELAPIGPVLRITHPVDENDFPYGAPITLEGVVQDPEHPSRSGDAERLIWTIDDRVVGFGPVSSIDPPDPGKHIIGLAYRTGDRRPDANVDPAELPSTSVRLRVRESDSIPAAAWPEISPFDRI